MESRDIPTHVLLMTEVMPHSSRTRFVLSVTGARLIGYPHGKKTSRFLSCTILKLNSRWIINLMVKGETIKPLDDDKGKYVHNFG